DRPFAEREWMAPRSAPLVVQLATAGHDDEIVPTQEPIAVDPVPNLSPAGSNLLETPSEDWHTFECVTYAVHSYACPARRGSDGFSYPSVMHPIEEATVSTERESVGTMPIHEVVAIETDPGEFSTR